MGAAAAVASGGHGDWKEVVGGAGVRAGDSAGTGEGVVDGAGDGDEAGGDEGAGAGAGTELPSAAMAFGVDWIQQPG